MGAMTTAPTRSSGVPGRTPTTLALLAVVLCVAFVRAPITVAAGTSLDTFTDQPAIVAYLQRAFVQYWQSGHRTFTPGMAALVAYWSHYHIAKAAVAAILAIVFGGLSVSLWKSVLRTGGPGTAIAFAVSGVACTVLALASVAITLANIQGAAAPFASLLSMLPIGTHDPQLAAAVNQIHHQLATYPGARTPALTVMVDDYARYHVVLAVAAVIVAIALAGSGVAAWKWFVTTASSQRRTRSVAAFLGVLAVVTTLAVLAVAVANVSNAADPAPGLLSLFDGGS
jgi:hypothetical protein